jgi:replicative DNA helicase
MKFFDVDSERLALAAMIENDKCLNYGLMNLTIDHFTDGDNKIAFDCIKTEFEKNPNCNYVNFIDRLQTKLEKLIALKIAHSNTNQMIRIREFKELCNLLSEKYLIRKYRNIGLEIESLTKDTSEGGQTASDISKQIERMLMDIIGKNENKDCISYKEVLNRSLKSISDVSCGKIPWIKTGYEELDNFLVGYMPGELVIIAGRASQGKTIFAQIAAENMAQSGYPVDIFEMEMRCEGLGNRALSEGSGVDYRKIRTAKFNDEEAIKVNDCFGYKSKYNIWVDDTGRTNVNVLCAKIRYNVMRHQSKVIIIDHLMYVYNDQSDKNLTYSVGFNTKILKSLGKELGVVIIILCHVKRGDDNDDSMPDLRDLKYSGDIENDADVVIGLHRHDYYHQYDEGYIFNNILDVLILKGRDSGTGLIKMHYDYSKMQIKPLDNHSKYLNNF